jgi:hypothetical protein
MKVKISVTLNVDAEGWAKEFHIERDEVREDVQVYMAEACYEQLLLLGLKAP